MATIEAKKETDEENAFSASSYGEVVTKNTDEKASMIAAVAATAAMNMLSRGANRVIIYDPKGCCECWATLDSTCHSLDWNGRRVSSILALLIKIALEMCGDSFDLLPLSINEKITPDVN